MYNPNDGRSEIKLLRCNGKHGVFNRGNNGFDPGHPHWDFHIHKASEDALDSGNTAEKNATVTSEFASSEEAAQYFVKAVNIDQRDADLYFPTNIQTEIDFGGE
jgi:hypothetical protein